MKKIFIVTLDIMLAVAAALLVNVSAGFNAKEVSASLPAPTPLVKNDLEYLKVELQNKISKFGGDYSLYVKDLSNGNTLSINDVKKPSASLIKLFIMAETFEEIKGKNISYTTYVQTLLYNMIAASDNESANELVEITGNGNFKNGLKKVNSFITSGGYQFTVQKNDIQNSRPNPIPIGNFTSVSDCGLLLENIYNGDCVSPEYDEQMLKLLSSQETTDKIPKGLPAGTKFANKTGELGTSEHDAAIIFSPETDYILCIMTTGVKDSEKTKTEISEVSSLVYNYFNNF